MASLVSYSLYSLRVGIIGIASTILKGAMGIALESFLSQKKHAVVALAMLIYPISAKLKLLVEALNFLTKDPNTNPNHITWNHFVNSFEIDNTHRLHRYHAAAATWKISATHETQTGKVS